MTDGIGGYDKDFDADIQNFAVDADFEPAFWFLF